MRRVSARWQLHHLRVRHVRGNAVHLRHGAVLVVFALNREQRLGDGGHRAHEIPVAKRRIQPDIVPAPERRIDIVVIAPELRAQIGGLVDGLRLRNALHRHVLDEQMRRKHDRAREPVGKRGGEQQRDRAAVAMAHEPHTIGVLGLDAERVEKGGQHFARLTVHEVHRPLLVVRARRGTAVAVARVHQPPVTACVAQLLRPVFPHGDGAESFMQEDQQRSAGALAVDPSILQRERAVRGRLDPGELYVRHLLFVS